MNNNRLKIIPTEDTSLCIIRKKIGRGFQYFDGQNNKIKDKKQLNYFKKLVIPPMWNDVKICEQRNGHIQATGRDAKGRKQYIYHKEWEAARQREKFLKMKDFGKQLPKIRQKCLNDIKRKGWSKDKVLALIIFILDAYGLRIGNQKYSKNNGTYGLTTLRRKHLEIDEEELIFNYTGKSGKNRAVHIDDEFLIPMIEKCAELPGYEIFRFRDANGKMQDIDSKDVNDYIKDCIGEDFSAKDFRTWLASRLAVVYFPEALKIAHKNTRKKLEPTLVRLVAEELGNTVSVCRTYYIHPKILELVKNRKLPLLENFDNNEIIAHSAVEKTLLKLI